MSISVISPVIVCPSENGRLNVLVIREGTSDLNATICLLVLGISIPTLLVPGIVGSTLTDELDTCKFLAMSSVMLIIFEAFTPILGMILNRVTVGP